MEKEKLKKEFEKEFDEFNLEICKEAVIDWWLSKIETLNNHIKTQDAIINGLEKLKVGSSASNIIINN